MDWIKGWMLSIIGITLLSAMAELILPDAEMKRFTKLIIGIVMIVILMRPIAEIKDYKILNYEFQIEEQLAVTKQAEALEQVQWTQIEQEFSKRMSAIMIQRLGKQYSHIRLKADLVRHDIHEVVIENAAEQEKAPLLQLFKQEFNLSPDKITFIGG